MILSVVLYNHKLTLGQWGGAGVVFAGIGVEAWVKRKGAFVLVLFWSLSDDLVPSAPDIHAKRVVQEKEKAKIKSL